MCRPDYHPIVIAIMSANSRDSRAILAPRNPTAVVASTSSIDTTTTTTNNENTILRRDIRLSPNFYHTPAARGVRARWPRVCRLSEIGEILGSIKCRRRAIHIIQLWIRCDTATTRNMSTPRRRRRVVMVYRSYAMLCFGGCGFSAFPS